LIINQKFRDSVDDIVEFALKYDPELTEDIKWLDGEAQKKGISFYEMAFEVLNKFDINSKAREWLHAKQKDAKVNNS